MKTTSWPESGTDKELVKRKENQNVPEVPDQTTQNSTEGTGQRRGRQGENIPTFAEHAL